MPQNERVPASQEKFEPRTGLPRAIRRESGDQASVRPGGRRSSRLFALPEGMLTVPVPRRIYMRKGYIHLVVNRVIFGLPVNRTEAVNGDVLTLLGIEDNEALVKLENGHTEHWPPALESTPVEK